MNLLKLSLMAAVVAIMSTTASADLVKVVGDFQPRFKPGSGGNGPADASQAVLTSGVHAILYSGTIADFTTGAVDNARPFIGFDQAGAAVSGFAYVDNISLTVGGVSVWSEDFEAAALGAHSELNSTLPGTVVQSANALIMDVVAAPALFTSASGQAVLIGTDTNAFSAIRPSSNPINFTSVPDTTAYTMSFDLYIPSAVPEPSSLALLGFTSVGLVARRRRRKA